MATRGLIRFAKREDGVTFNEHPGVDKIHVEIYNHYDSYPEGLGVDLSKFLNELKVVNGLGDRTVRVANGMGCLAAQLVADMKTEPGQVYLYKPNEDKGWAEYVYYIWVAERKDIWLSIFDYYDNCIFVGKPSKLIEKYNTN